MAMDYTEQHSFRVATSNQPFWDRCEEAILHVARAIKNEGDQVENHAARLAWAATAGNSPSAILNEQFKNAITMHNLIQEHGSAIENTNGTWSGLYDVIGSLVNEFA